MRHEFLEKVRWQYPMQYRIITKKLAPDQAYHGSLTGKQPPEIIVVRAQKRK